MKGEPNMWGGEYDSKGGFNAGEKYDHPHGRRMSGSYPGLRRKFILQGGKNIEDEDDYESRKGLVCKKRMEMQKPRGACPSFPPSGADQLFCWGTLFVGWGEYSSPMGGRDSWREGLSMWRGKNDEIGGNGKVFKGVRPNINVGGKGLPGYGKEEKVGEKGGSGPGKQVDHLFSQNGRVDEEAVGVILKRVSVLNPGFEKDSRREKEGEVD